MIKENVSYLFEYRHFEKKGLIILSVMCIFTK